MDDFPWLPQIDLKRCTGCGLCVALCPTGALGRVDGFPAVVRPANCLYCAQCEEHCPEEAIALPYLVCLSRDSAAKGANP